MWIIRAGFRLGLSPSLGYRHLPYNPNTRSDTGLKFYTSHAYTNTCHIVDHCNMCPQVARGCGHMTYVPNTSAGLSAKFPNCATFLCNLWKRACVLGLGIGNSKKTGY
jgi:hypothetical protein